MQSASQRTWVPRAVGGLALAWSAACAAGSAPRTPATAANWQMPDTTRTVETAHPVGAIVTGEYPNLFVSLLGKSPTEVQARVDAAWQQLFGADSTRTLYFPVGDDMAYIPDIIHNDVRSEGMSYGMMTAVQLDKQQQFDALWKWVKTYMGRESGPRAGYFAWHTRYDGTVLDQNSASDGEEWFAMALFFASGRWGDHTGVNYRAAAQTILDAMLSKGDSTTPTDMFNRDTRQIVFVPEQGLASSFTDPSYHLPHYYELWARYADKNNEFWCQAAAASRELLRAAAHPQTGLFPDYSTFTGQPTDPWNGGAGNFQYDAFRVGANIGVDHAWFARDPWQSVEANRLLDFFASQGMDRYASLYTLDGTPRSGPHGSALAAMNAVAALAATNANRAAFVQALWDMPVPSGPGRYYDGTLYMLALLEASGNFRAWAPAGAQHPGC